MESNSTKPPVPEQTPNNFSDCHRQSCLLRVPATDGTEECLMESVRLHWTDPKEVNYCKDPNCKKFVDHINQKLESQNKRKR